MQEQKCENYELIKKEILLKLNEKGSQGFWIWHLFILCFIPGILNGLHISSYVFIGQNPTKFYCILNDLENANWNLEQIINISTMYNGKKITEDECNVINWNYRNLSLMDYDKAVIFTNNENLPNTTPCLSNEQNHFKYHYKEYDSEDISIVSQWNLVCEKSSLRTTAQGALAFGKLAGAFIFGIIADKFGRRLSFLISSVIYIICGPIAAYTYNYIIFLLARIGLGIAGSGTYHNAYTILNEIAGKNYRSWMSIFFSAGYPLGMILCALFGYLIPHWRTLQMVLATPALILIYHWIFLIESPRWLINQHRINQAYKIVFNETINFNEKNLNETKENNSNFLIECFKEIKWMYGSSILRNRIMICKFVWFAACLSYYAIALNSENFSTNPYMYVAITGVVEIPSYIIPIFFVKYIGKKLTSQTLFTIAGGTLLLILAVPKDNEIAIISIAMIGRLCISSAFAVVILYTCDLFPTEIRGSAIGISSTSAHTGSIIAPFIVDLLGLIAWFIPTTICAGFALISALLIIFLPETKEITDKVEEINQKN